MKRHLLLGVGLMVGLGLLALREVAIAQDKSPIPVKRIPTQGFKKNIKLKLDQPTKGATKLALIQKNSSGVSTVGVYATGDSILRGSGELITKAQSGESLAVRGDPYGKVLGAYFRKGYEQHREGFSKGRYLVFGSDGVSKLVVTGIDGTMSIQPAPSGMFALGWYGLNAPGAFPTFYYGGGRKKKAENWPADQHINGVAFSPDGGLIGIGASSQDGGRTHVSFYDAQGRRVWEAPAIGAVTFSSDGRQIALVMTDKVEIRDKSGKVLRETSVPGLNASSKAEFSGDGKRLAVTTASSGVRIIRVDNGAVIGSWEWAKSDTIIALGKGIQFQIVGISVSQDGTSLGVAGISWHLKPVQLQGWGDADIKDPESLADLVIMLNEIGKVKDEVALPPSVLLKDSESPIVVSADGKSVTVPTSSRILSYEVDN